MKQASPASADVRCTPRELRTLSELLGDKYRHENSGKLLSPAGTFDLEAILHELSHVAVLGLTLSHVVDGNLSNAVSSGFEVYDNNPAASDQSEIRTLAVELHTARWLGLKLSHKRLMEVSAQGMRIKKNKLYSSWTTPRELIGRLSGRVFRCALERVSRRRAMTVLTWIYDDIKEAKRVSNSR